MGICLLAFCTGVLAIGKFGTNLDVDALRTLAFIVLVFGSQATIYAIRERRRLWGSRPSLLLVASSVTDIAIASTLAAGGIAMTPLPAMVVVGTLLSAVAFAFVLDFVKVPVFARLGIAQSAHLRHVVPKTPGIAKAEGKPAAEARAGQPKAADLRPEAKGAPQREAEPKPKPDAEHEPAKSDVATLLNTTLGDILEANLAKHPQDAGRIVAAAITEAAGNGAVKKTPEVDEKAQPDRLAEPRPHAETNTQRDSAPKTAA
jgi:hypothetical protein